MTSEAIPANSAKTIQARLNALGKSLSILLPRLGDLFVNAILQLRILKKAYPGIMHFLIFWGVAIQVIGTAINLMQMALFIPFVELPLPRGGLYLAYELIMDLAGVAILLGVAMALFRRLVLRPKTLETAWDDYYALTMLALIPIVGFTTEALRLRAAAPAWAAWSPVGSAYAGLLASLGLSQETAMAIHPYLFWGHAALALILIASVPFTKMRHLVNTPANIFFRSRRKDGILSKIEDIEETELLGVGEVSEFTSQQLLSFDACTRCGRCEEACPASISGMSYSPRTLMHSLRDSMVATLVSPNGSGKRQSLEESISEETIWSCTTCGACLVKCPAFVNPVDEIIDLRRYQALTTGKLPKSIADTLRNMERQGNPWGMPAEDRIAWSEGLNVRELMPGEETDVLLFLGCAFAFDDRNKKVTKSFVRLLQKADVDFAILGLDESCCGETARRMGHEYLFQVFAEQNIEIFKSVKFNRIVTQCPHCFNTLKNEYPQMGGDFVVQHYSEYLAELDFPWAAVSPNGDAVHGQVAFHDSCYLGRYNQIYKQPRQLLENSKVSTIEMPRNGENSFCCGGGGGQMWMETDAETRINQQRLQDALDVKTDVVATACPYCLLMFDDAIRSKGLSEQVEVMDIAEIIDRHLT